MGYTSEGRVGLPSELKVGQVRITQLRVWQGGVTLLRGEGWVG